MPFAPSIFYMRASAESDDEVAAEMSNDDGDEEMTLFYLFRRDLLCKCEDWRIMEGEERNRL